MGKYEEILKSYRYSLDKDGLFRDHKGALKCSNPVLEDLVIRQKTEKLSYQEEQLYGQLLMTLCKIVMKHHVFRNQKPELKEECLMEGLANIIEKGIRGFNPEKGRAYSYLYRLCYTAGIHVLEAKNDRISLDAALQDLEIGDSGSDFRTRDSGDILDFGRKVNTAYSDMAYC